MTLDKSDRDRFEADPSLFIKEIIRKYITGNPDNRLPDHDNEPIFDEPLVGFADGDDPIFQEFKKEAVIGEFDIGLEEFAPFLDADFDPVIDGIPLRLVDDSAHIDRLIQGFADAKLAHAPLELGDEAVSHIFLHQEARTGAANLALVKPDGVDHAFNRAVQIGVVKDNKGRLAA